LKAFFLKECKYQNYKNGEQAAIAGIGNPMTNQFLFKEG